MIKSIGHSLRRRLSFTPLRWVVNQYRHRGFESGDVFLGAFPKSGSTWLRSMLTTLLLDRCEDWESVKDLSRIVGRHFDAPRHLPNNGRLIKTHERFSPHYRRAILMIRDGRDTAVSLYFYNNRDRSPEELQNPAMFSEFIKQLLAGKASPYGNWQDHVLSWQKGARIEGNEITTIRYEDCKNNPVAELRKVVEFLGIQASEARLQAAVEQNDLKKMRERERISDQKSTKPILKVPFVRQGIVGGWKQHFTPELEKRFLAVTREAMVAGGYIDDGI